MNESGGFSNSFTSLDHAGLISYGWVITKISPGDKFHSIHKIPLIHPHIGIEYTALNVPAPQSIDVYSTGMYGTIRKAFTHN